MASFCMIGVILSFSPRASSVAAWLQQRAAAAASLLVFEFHKKEFDWKNVGNNLLHEIQEQNARLWFACDIMTEKHL